MATMTARRKRCKACGELFPPDEVINGLCEDCDSHYTFCAICDEQQHEDSACRHVFAATVTSWEWMGAGSYNGTDKPEDHKESFFAVLDRVGVAELLRHAIEADTLETKYYGPMIGGASYWCWLRPPGAPYGSDFGNLFTDDLTEELEESMTIGVGWLDSIQYDDSPIRAKAREITIAWIDEWLAAPARRLGAGYGFAESSRLWRTNEAGYRWDGSDACRLAYGYGKAADDHFDAIERDRRRRSAD
jgi:hypothetical protein